MDADETTRARAEADAALVAARA
ncbi:MAG: hypothetical protein JWP66_1078, partial [Naasia sp.]|nr:hypothetical protein [Naasia sp.]